MDDLRLIILALGVVVIGVIYLWGKRRARNDEWELPADADLRGERVLPDEVKPEDEWEIIPLRAARNSKIDEGALEQMRGLASQSKPLGDDIPTLTDVVGTAKPPVQLPEIVVALTIIAKSGHSITGHALLDAVRKTGMVYGNHNIFHRIINGDTIFSMANILEPGHFDLNAMDKFATPGIALFMRLPGKAAGTLAVQQMLETARTMAQLLDARICDERRTPITEQGFARMLEKARPYAPVTTKTH